jgi:hypothetical protein
LKRIQQRLQMVLPIHKSLGLWLELLLLPKNQKQRISDFFFFDKKDHELITKDKNTTITQVLQ